MDSNWEIGKKLSNYHFNKWQDEVPNSTHKVVGKFTGDWSGELETIYANMTPVTWAARWDEYGKVDPRRNLKEAELNDLRNSGADPDMHMYQGLKTLGPKMIKMVECLELDTASYKLQIQKTGDMVVTHFDKHYEFDDETQTRRFLIALTDWEQGQFVNFGNDIWQQWRSGDIATFEWINVPHSTANASFYLRPFLQVTGVMTEKTYALMDNYTVFEI